MDVVISRMVGLEHRQALARLMMKFDSADHSEARGFKDETLVSKDATILLTSPDVFVSTAKDDKEYIGLLISSLSEPAVLAGRDVGRVGMSGFFWVKPGTSFRVAANLLFLSLSWYMVRGVNLVAISCTEKNEKRKAWQRLGFKTVCRDTHGQSIMMASACHILERVERYVFRTRGTGKL